jgi:hypothetical protein
MALNHYPDENQVRRTSMTQVGDQGPGAGNSGPALHGCDGQGERAASQMLAAGAPATGMGKTGCGVSERVAEGVTSGLGSQRPSPPTSNPHASCH